MYSEFIDSLSNPENYRPGGYVKLKGKAKKVLVYELYSHQKQDVIDWKNSTKAEVIAAIKLELEGKYDESIEAVERLIARCPKHSYIEGEILDPMLKIAIKEIKEKLTSSKRGSE